MPSCLIIGVSGGVGSKIAEHLTNSGYEVIGTYNENDPKATSPNSKYYRFNVLEEVSSIDFLPEVLDGLVYCPGNINLRPFERIKADDFINDFQLQVVGAIKIIQQALPRLKKSNTASVVLFSSAAVQLGLSYHTQVAVSKGAIEGLVRALAAEFAPAIRVNGIAPSITDTPLASSLLNNVQKRETLAKNHPLKRIGTTQDIANLAEFLISTKSDWMTGQVIHLDGGISKLKT